MEDLNNHYDRIAVAIDYIKTHFKDQPDLNEVAQAGTPQPFFISNAYSRTGQG